MAHHKTTEENVLCVFEQRFQVERAIGELIDAGFHTDHISIVMLGAQQVMTAAAAASVVRLGAAEVMNRLTSVTVPGLGLLLTTGPFGNHLCNQIASGTSGGFVRALVDFGLPEDEARAYEHDIRDGGILLTIKCGDRCDEARSILASCGAINFGPHLGIGGRTWSGAMPRMGYPGYPTPSQYEDIETD